MFQPSTTQKPQLPNSTFTTTAAIKTKSSIHIGQRQRARAPIATQRGQRNQTILGGNYFGTFPQRRQPDSYRKAVLPRQQCGICQATGKCGSSLSSVQLGELAKKHCTLQPPPLVPEVPLYLLGTEDIIPLWSELEKMEGSGEALPPPYWAVAWPGALLCIQTCT